MLHALFNNFISAWLFSARLFNLDSLKLMIFIVGKHWLRILPFAVLGAAVYIYGHAILMRQARVSAYATDAITLYLLWLAFLIRSTAGLRFKNMQLSKIIACAAFLVLALLVSNSISLLLILSPVGVLWIFWFLDGNNLNPIVALRNAIIMCIYQSPFFLVVYLSAGGILYLLATHGFPGIITMILNVVCIMPLYLLMLWYGYIRSMRQYAKNYFRYA